MPDAWDKLTSGAVDRYNKNLIDIVTGKPDKNLPSGKMIFVVYDSILKKRQYFALQYNPETLQITVESPGVAPVDITITEQYLEVPPGMSVSQTRYFQTTVSMQTMFENIISRIDIKAKLDWLVKYHMNDFLVFIGSRIYKGQLKASSWDIQKFDPKFKLWQVNVNLSWYFVDTMDKATIDQYSDETAGSAFQASIKKPETNVLDNYSQTNANTLQENANTALGNLFYKNKTSLTSSVTKIDPKTGKTK